MMEYRLHRYFCSSRPVVPLLMIAFFSGVMFSMKPLNVCSGYVLAGVIQFVLMTFVTLGLSGSEEIVEEQLILFHGNSRSGYFAAREMTLVLISCLYGLLFAFVPVVLNCFNRFSLFTRALSAGDVAMGAMIILGSGVAGTAIGDVFHPRIMGDRKMAVTVTVGMILLSIVKDAVFNKLRFLRCLGILIPSVMKPAHDLGNGDYFEAKSVTAFLVTMVLYYLAVIFIKNLILNRKKFS